MNSAGQSWSLENASNILKKKFKEKQNVKKGFLRTESFGMIIG